MFFHDEYIGCPYGCVENLRKLNNKLNSKVSERVNESQELTMLSVFARESNEYQFKTILKDRICELESWRLVLIDLSKRLEEAIGALLHEQKALNVVVNRVQDEIDLHSKEASKPGSMNPQCDCIEDVILQEYKFLRAEKKKFEGMIPCLNKQIAALGRTKERIDNDVMKKQVTISLEEACGNTVSLDTVNRSVNGKKKKKYSPMCNWEKKCMSLKRDGLQALSDAILTRQQVRGARVGLSITAQAHSSRVDSALRKRLHANTVKLQELSWQKNETIRDLEALNEELLATEQNIVEIMNQESLIEARLIDRSRRPVGEMTKDHVDRQLRDELGRLRHFAKHLRTNMDKIISLQNHLTNVITCFDCCAEDLLIIIRLDEQRLSSRELNENQKTHTSSTNTSNAKPTTSVGSQRTMSESRSQLSIIQEIDDEDENDYPFEE